MSQLTQNTIDLDALIEKANALPETLDTSDATAVASNILSGKTAYANGQKLTGTMANNGAISKTLDTSALSYTVPAGYTSGGTVKITTEIKTATPTTSEQLITPSSGKVLESVLVEAVPTEIWTFEMEDGTTIEKAVAYQ